MFDTRKCQPLIVFEHMLYKGCAFSRARFGKLLLWMRFKWAQGLKLKHYKIGEFLNANYWNARHFQTNAVGLELHELVCCKIDNNLECGASKYAATLGNQPEHWEDLSFLWFSCDKFCGAVWLKGIPSGCALHANATQMGFQLNHFANIICRLIFVQSQWDSSIFFY